MFLKWSLKFKLMAFALCSGFCLLVVGTVGIYALKNVYRAFDHVAEVNLPKAQVLSEMLIAQRDMAIAFTNMINGESSKQKVDQTRDTYRTLVEQFEKATTAYESIELVPGEKERWRELMTDWKLVKEQFERILDLSASGREEDRLLRDKLASNELLAARRTFREGAEGMVTFQRDEAKKWSTRADEINDSSSWILILSVVAGFLLALLIGLYMANAICRTMSEVVGQLSHGAGEVAAAATEISSTAEELSASSVEQASSLQETASSMEEMSSMVKQNATNAGRSSEIAKAGQETAGKGKQVVNEMISALGDIDAANREISEVVKVIGQIGNKTRIIDDIVFKTQLLSFNASVEAARAGEHGKGFAVVAEEVGNLAQMSGTAAREISELLEQSLDRVERMILTSKQKVEVGLHVGKRCGEVLDQLVDNVAETNSMANEIAAASQEQARGITEINRAVSQMDQVTQQNASVSQQSATAAEQLSQQAETLRFSVGELANLLNGSKGASDVAPAPSPVKLSQSTPTLKKGKQGERVKLSSKGLPDGKHPGFDEAA